MRFVLALGFVASSAAAQSTWTPQTPTEAIVGVGVALVGTSVWGSAHASSEGTSRRSSGLDRSCHDDGDCADTTRCERQQCVRRGAVAATQRDDAARLFLRSRAVALREELALGRGPVLAAVAGEAAGPALKAHRAELVALIGDGSDPAWPDRFLARAAALVSPLAGAVACAPSP